MNIRIHFVDDSTPIDTMSYSRFDFFEFLRIVREQGVILYIDNVQTHVPYHAIKKIERID